MPVGFDRCVYLWTCPTLVDVWIFFSVWCVMYSALNSLVSKQLKEVSMVILHLLSRDIDCDNTKIALFLRNIQFLRTSIPCVCVLYLYYVIVLHYMTLWNTAGILIGQQHCSVVRCFCIIYSKWLLSSQILK